MRQSNRTLLTACAIGIMAACSARSDRPVASDANGKSSVSPSSELAATQGKSMIRLVNALAAGSPITVQGDDRTLFTSVAYKTVTPYLEIANNRMKFSLRPVLKDSAVADNTEIMRDGGRYTIVAMSTDEGGGRLRIVKDETSTDSTKAHVRVINAASGAKNVDVALQGQKDALFSNVGYASEAGYADIAPVTATVEIRRNDPSTRPVLIRNMAFKAGRSYSIVLTGSRPGTIEAITVEDAETGPTLSMR